MSVITITKENPKNFFAGENARALCGYTIEDEAQDIHVRPLLPFHALIHISVNYPLKCIFIYIRYTELLE